MTQSSKKSFRLKSNKNGTLEFTQVNESSDSVSISIASDKEMLPVVEPKKSWSEKLIQKLKEHGQVDREELKLYKDAKVSLSAFESIKLVNPYILVGLRFVIFIFSASLLIKTFKEFCGLVKKVPMDKEGFDKFNYFYRLALEFSFASVKASRSFLLIFLMSLAPLFNLFYAYFIGFLGTLYVTMWEDNKHGLEKYLWTEKVKLNDKESRETQGNQEFESSPQSSNRQMRRDKSFFWNRMESCSVSMDCVLSYALTPFLLNSLVYFNFKNIPEISIFYSVALVVLVLVDEILMKKRKMELEAVLRLARWHGFILLFGLSWIFYIRLSESKRINRTSSEDWGVAIFMAVIIIFGHFGACYIKFMMRRVKVADQKIIKMPNFNDEIESENLN